LSGLYGEIHLVSRRMLAWRLMPLLVAASALVVIASGVVAPTPSGAIHHELARLQSGNEITGFVLMVAAFLSAYLLLAPDLHEEFESMSSAGGSRPLTFAAARVLVGAAGLLATTLALGVAVELLDVGGRYQGAEVLHLLVLFANAVPVFVLALVLTSMFGRIAGVIVTFFLLSVGSDAAYQRASAADHFIEPSGLYSAEQLVAALGPRPLVDPLPGIALIDQSVALNQFPIREGQGVWGADLIQVSGAADITHYFAYLAALAAVLYVVCLFRSARARSRFHLVPAWLEKRG
jgi:hypothetical protein